MLRAAPCVLRHPTGSLSTPAFSGAQTEHTAHTEGNVNTKPRIPPTPIITRVKSYSHGMLLGLLVLELKSASPIHCLKSDFQEREEWWGRQGGLAQT